jgi:hypothetical protein
MWEELLVPKVTLLGFVHRPSCNKNHEVFEMGFISISHVEKLWPLGRVNLFLGQQQCSGTNNFSFYCGGKSSKYKNDLGNAHPAQKQTTDASDNQRHLPKINGVHSNQ